MEAYRLILSILDYVFFGVIVVLAGYIAVYVANEHGLFDSEEKLRNRILSAWSDVQRLAVRCGTIQVIMLRGHQTWHRIAPEYKPRAYYRNVQGNLKALQRVREDMVKAAKRGLRLSRGYLAEEDYEVSTEILSLRTVLGLVKHCCENCSLKEDGICVLQEQIGDPAQFGVETDVTQNWGEVNAK